MSACSIDVATVRPDNMADIPRLSPDTQQSMSSTDAIAEPAILHLTPITDRDTKSAYAIDEATTSKEQQSQEEETVVYPSPADTIAGTTSSPPAESCEEASHSPERSPLLQPYEDSDSDSDSDSYESELLEEALTSRISAAIAYTNKCARENSRPATCSNFTLSITSTTCTAALELLRDFPPATLICASPTSETYSLPVPLVHREQPWNFAVDDPQWWVGKSAVEIKAGPDADDKAIKAAKRFVNGRENSEKFGARRMRFAAERANIEVALRMQHEPEGRVNEEGFCGSLSRGSSQSLSEDTEEEGQRHGRRKSGREAVGKRRFVVLDEEDEHEEKVQSMDGNMDVISKIDGTFNSSDEYEFESEDSGCEIEFTGQDQASDQEDQESDAEYLPESEPILTKQNPRKRGRKVAEEDDSASDIDYLSRTEVKKAWKGGRKRRAADDDSDSDVDYLPGMKVIDVGQSRRKRRRRL